MSRDGFLDKLKQTLLDHIQEEKFGVSQLASAVGMSRSQLLRKIKSLTGKSANQFIKEIRLEESVRLIKNEELTAAEVSYKVGFSSPSYFNKCFLDRYGIPPGEYKNNLDNGVHTEIEVAELNTGKRRKTILTAIIFIVAVVLVGLIPVLNNYKGSEPVKKSIAILPLLDLSENTDKEYLADGLTEAITMYLSQSKSLRVISRGSAMRYKGEKKLYPEIAKELGVDLLLEGSVHFSGDTMRVVAQLIEPLPKEKHIWADAYDQVDSNILGLAGIITNDITREITAVNTLEKEITKIELGNREAYDLYLRGRHLWNTQKTRKKSLLKALDYLTDAIQKDPKLAMAYVTLAETYLAINAISGDHELAVKYREKARNAVDKALALDQSLAEAYVTRGSIKGKIDWDWEGMKLLAEKALEVAPNNADAHMLLSDYYVIKNYYQKAVEESLIAERLDPLNPSFGYLVGQRHYITGNYEQAIKKYQDVIDFHPDYGWAYDGLGFAWLKVGKEDEAIESWQKLQQIMGNDELYQCYNDRGFMECLHYFLKNATNNEPRYCSNPMIISSIFMLTNNQDEALNYINIAYKYRTENLPVTLTYPDFYPLHNRVEFRKIVEQVGVSLPTPSAD